ncbi:MAG: hypothetical protein AB1916_11025 [Thermodesulfobacteriota bacterium]
MNPGNILSDLLDPTVVNLLTALAVFVLSCALGGWVAWRRHKARRGKEPQTSRKQDTEAT